MSRNPTLAELMNIAIDNALEELPLWLPGRVVRYDAATQQADVQPIQKKRRFDEDGAAIVQQLPVIPSVPVEFPGGGGFTVTFPIEVGDTVILMFSGVSMDKWLQGGTDQPLDPETHARHALSDAVAIPGLRRFTNARASMPTDHVRIGADGETAQGVALGEVLQTLLDSIRSAYNTHTHPAPGGATSAPAALLPANPTVASSTVKVTE